MLQPKVSVLRISDHKTKGLEGADTCEKGTSWSRLVKENGSSNKGQGSGGSFGIGKAAAFACSDLRTVFYSSKDIKGIESNFGVAKLISFEDESKGTWTTGMGYYSEDENFKAIRELSNFDASYKRNDSGTDIYVLGLHDTEEFKKDFIKAVLLDFLVSLINKKLVVKIQNEIIDDKTLSKYISELNPHEDDSIKDLIMYHHILTSNDPSVIKVELEAKKYGEKYGFKDKECILYLKEGEGFNRKIMITRRAGMRILEKNRISGSIDFSGVLVIYGDNMNETFKKMEVPSHDAWEPGRVRGEEKKYKKILDGLNKYLRDTVKDILGKITTDSMDALGASDFLPDSQEEGNGEKTNKDELSTRVSELTEKIVKPSNQKNINNDDINIDDDGGDDIGGKGGEPGRPRKPNVPHPGSGDGPSPGDNNDKLKQIPLKKRLICKDPTLGLYYLTFIIPNNSSVGKLMFSISGEQSDFDLPILDLKIIEGNASVDQINKNIVYLSELKKGDRLRVEIKVDFDEYCMMEVDYYAIKK